jgi:hypothetical protein
MENSTHTNHFIHQEPFCGVKAHAENQNGGYVILNIGNEISLFIYNPNIVSEIAEALICANREFRSIKQDESKDNHGTTPQS